MLRAMVYLLSSIISVIILIWFFMTVGLINGLMIIATVLAAFALVNWLIRTDREAG